MTEEALSDLIAKIADPIIIILIVVSIWHIYGKMGEKKWAMLIPIYGEYVLHKKIWNRRSYAAKFLWDILQYLPLISIVGIFVLFNWVLQISLEGGMVDGGVLLTWATSYEAIWVLVRGYMSGGALYAFNVGLNFATDGGAFNVIFGLLVMLGAVGVIVHSIRVRIYLAKSFGHGIIFAVGLILLPFLFYPILAFGKSQYIDSGFKLKKQEEAEELEEVTENE